MASAASGLRDDAAEANPDCRAGRGLRVVGIKTERRDRSMLAYIMLRELADEGKA